MNLFSTLIWQIITFIICFICLNACHTKSENAFDEIVNAPQFKPYTDSIGKYPTAAFYYYERGLALKNNAYELAAYTDFCKAWQLQKDFLFADEIINYLQKTKPDSVLLFINSAIKILPSNKELYLAKINFLQLQSKNQQALAVCDSALKLFPSDEKLKSLSLLLSLNQGDEKFNIDNININRQIREGNKDLMYQLGFELAQNKNKNVLAFCDTLIKLTKSQEPEPFYFKGVYFSNIKNTEKAILCFNDAIISNYHFVDAYLEKVKIYFEEKKIEQAIKILEQANQVAPANADVYFWIAKCQEATGNKTEAKENYLKAYSLDKSLSEAKAAAEKM